MCTDTITIESIHAKALRVLDSALSRMDDDFIGWIPTGEQIQAVLGTVISTRPYEPPPFPFGLPPIPYVDPASIQPGGEFCEVAEDED